MLTVCLLSLISLINVFGGEYETVFDGVWDFEHEDRSFRVHVCSVEEEDIYLSLGEVWFDDDSRERPNIYTVGVAHFDKISESDKKIVMASTDSYVLAERTDRNKNGYFESIFVLRYEKEEDNMYIHFKLRKKDRPTNIIMNKEENASDEFIESDEFSQYACWIPPERKLKIHNNYPQVWKEFGAIVGNGGPRSDQQISFIISRKKEKSGCWGYVDNNGNIKNEQGGYFTSIDLKYDDKLMLTKWYDVGLKYKTNNKCKSGTGMFMIFGKIEYEYIAMYSYQCNDGKSGYQKTFKIWKEVSDGTAYQCPLLTPPKTDL